LSTLHHQEFFANCDGDDCWSNKGFSATAVQMGSLARLWVINTHMQAAYDSPTQHSDTRLQQLTQMMNYVSTLPAHEPVLLLGDLNIVAGQQEYIDRMGDVLSGWGDLIAGIFGNAALPFTSDKTRNAYGHFWHHEYHIFEHENDDAIPRPLAPFGPDPLLVAASLAASVHPSPGIDACARCDSNPCRSEARPGALAPSSASRVRGPRSPSGRQRLSGGGAGGEKGLYFSHEIFVSV
jgi:hypothetical protein